MKKLIVPAPAKVNLFLHVTGRRADGYHTLESLIALIDLADTITLTRRDDGVIRREGDVAGVPEAHDLAMRAAHALRDATGSRHGVDIVIAKRIPLGSGLGGGSSDAASVLLALNRLWDLRLPRAELARLALALGADVPLFIGGENAVARGVGAALFCRARISSRGRVDDRHLRCAGIDTRDPVGENGRLFRGLWPE